MISNPIPWPNKARCAVAFTFDMDAEALLHVNFREQAPERVALASMLRYEPQVRAVYRLATTDVELSGVRIPRGANVLVMIGSANRDEAQFPDAHRFDIDRGAVNNLPFGHGIHFCLGAPLARLEARLALAALLPRIRGLSLAGPLEWRRSMSVRGVTRLPLVAHPA